MYRSFIYMMTGVCLSLVNSVCFAGVPSEFQNSALEKLNILSNSEIQTAIGPGQQYTQNHLGFTFDGSEQTNSSGTFRAVVTFPNQIQYSINGNFGPGSSPVTLQVGPPSLIGNYTLTFIVTNLYSGTIDPAQGPYGTAVNYTKGDRLNIDFNVQNVGDQDSRTFLNRA